MQRSLLLICLLITILTNLSWSQTPHPTCDGTRYLDEVFTNVDTTLNVAFGVHGTDTLYMDVYEPQGDVATARPVLILAFGGAFILGQREDMAPLCHYYAQRGFVTATIDYRLFQGPFIPFPDSVVFADVVMKAVSDMKASVRYFREDAATVNQYKIDPSIIFVGGGSAGAITALHTAYMDAGDNIPAHIQTAINNNGGWQGNSSANLQYSSAVNGVLNFSGALGSASWMDAGDVPVFSVHDDADGIVPYGQGYGTIANMPVSYVEGSRIITDTANALGIPNELITIPNSGGHVSYVNDPVWQDSIFTSSCVFLHEIVCPNITNLDQVDVRSRPAVEVYPNPADNYLMVEVEEMISTYSVLLYDNLGRLVLQKNAIETDAASLNLNLPKGTYHLQLVFDEKTILPINRKVLIR